MLQRSCRVLNPARCNYSPDMATGSPFAQAHANRCGRAFLGARHERNEQRTWWVVWLTAVMMLGEIIGGTLYGSMALVADGWHMATHAAALTIAGLAYRFARKHRDDPRFAFGTGKVGELAGFASAVTLGIVALLIVWESLLRLLNPHVIRFDQAIAIAVLGLAVNLASARLLHDDHAGHHDHDHGHGHEQDHEHDHDHHSDEQATRHGHSHARDSNLQAAYLHVIADAVTSVLAILGLLAGRLFGWIWLDPVIGIVGAMVICYWSWNLMRTAADALLDVSTNPRLLAAIAARLATDKETITDLHLWRVGPGHSALIVSLTSDHPASPDVYKARLKGLRGLSHVTIEVNARS
jgi:cation diffusion facilitator family transporter